MTQDTAIATLFEHVASPVDAIAHFRGRLGFEADVSDVHAALADGEPFVLIDTRNDAAWAQGHVPGAVHLPRRDIGLRAASVVPIGTPVVVYCWGPGCNGATRSALEFATLGYPVKEMIGGFEYWVREGFAFDTADGLAQRLPDGLTNVAPAGLTGADATTGAAPSVTTIDTGITCAC
ncbi:rhodanese-like domain-containing protein [Agromyces allii]|uniref:Rhodanese domain-containing protein n=1 Tax=Agromyces allii TaxID=393607 RepID=A0ABN2Q8Y0_9MICO|nr:rhodanese-like domain-containing protein [Agromyces allii]